MGISGFPLGSSETKSHLDVALVERHKVYYKGHGEYFEFKLPMARPSTKNALTMH